MGVTTMGRTFVRLRTPQSRYLVGAGKAEEIASEARNCGADVIIFDDSLTPSQQRNWEQLSGLAVIDRQEVILDIFAGRAKTREAVLQVALAKAEYDLPRLKRRWLHLSRQRGMRGGMGLRGEGEQQIEVDYRLVQRRISRLKNQLEEVRKQRRVQRSRRLKKPVPLAAIVGYTNAGKSSLLNALTDADVFVEDKLFATLDATCRRVVLPNQQELLLTDTVGFIRKLPHLLIDAFRATLEETQIADFLVEVIDVTSPVTEVHHTTTREVLTELCAARKPTLTVFTKTDLLTDRFTERRLRRKHPGCVFVSALTGAGLDELRAALAAELDAMLEQVEVLIPHDRYDLVAQLHRTSQILKEKHQEEGVRISARVPRGVIHAIEKFFLVRAS
jgi:GTP-binding protein HflX